MKGHLSDELKFPASKITMSLLKEQDRRREKVRQKINKRREVEDKASYSAGDF